MGRKDEDGVMVLDPKKEGVQHLIKEHGLKPEDIVVDSYLAGFSPKRVHGMEVSWNPLLRTTCWKVGSSFVRSGKYYRKKYERFKAYEVEHNQPREIPVEWSVGKIPVDEKIRELCKKKGKTGKTVYVIDKTTALRLKKKGVKRLEVVLTPKAVDERAKRRAVKLFMSHLWEVWRELDGLPVTEPYPSAVLGHSDVERAPRPGIGGI